MFVLLFTVETFFPLRESKAGLVARLIVNIGLTALAFLVAALFVRPSGLATLKWAAARPFGFMHWLHLPHWAEFIAGYASPDDNRFWRAFGMPFVKQRDYWRKADGGVPERGDSIGEKSKPSSGIGACFKHVIHPAVNQSPTGFYTHEKEWNSCAG